MADSDSALSAAAAPELARRTLPSPAPLRPLLARLRPYTTSLIFGAIALLLSSAIGLAFPLIVRELLDAAFVKGDGGLLNKLALLLVGIFAVQGVLSFVQVWLITSVAEKVIAKLRSELFAHLVRLSPGFFAEQRTGELTSRLSTDLTLLQSVMTYQSTELMRQLVYLIGGIAMLTITHPRLTVTTLAVVPVVVGAAFIFGRAMRKASTVVQDRIADAMGTADEAFSQIRTVQSFTRERAESARYDAQLSEVVDAAIHRALVRGVFFGVITFAGFAGVAAVLWQGGRLVLAHALTGGALVEFLFYAFFVAAAVGALGQLFGAYQEAIGAARRVFDLLDTKPTIADPPVVTPLPRPVRGDVRVTRRHLPLRKRAPGRAPRRDLHASRRAKWWRSSVRRARGRRRSRRCSRDSGMCSTAPSRSTAWTCARSRSAICAARSGSCRRSRRCSAARCATTSRTRARMRPMRRSTRAARAAHATEFIERLPDRMNTRVGERGVKLSGGQRQRIALARVFLKNPAVVILDEATSSLDTESERLVEQAMEELLRGRSTLIIAHRLSTVRRADRVIVLEGGVIVEEGSHEELIASGGLYSRLHRAAGLSLTV